MKNTIPLLLLYFLYGFIQAQPIPNWQWVHTQNGTQLEIYPRVAQDASKNMYSINTFYSPNIVVGNTTYNNAGTEYGDFVLAKYDAIGNVAWSKHIGTSAREEAYAIAIDRWDNIYVAGNFSGDSVKFDQVVLREAPNVGGSDIFLAKYNSSGNLVWARSWGDSLGETANALAFDTAGNIYMAGIFNGRKLRLGSYTLNNTSANTYSNGYIAKLDTNGNPLWASSFGNYGSELVNDIAVDKAGNIFITGFYYYGSLPTAQPDTIFPFRRFDEIYLLKYNANGVLQWGQNAGGANDDRAFSVSLDKDENPVIVGYIVGTVSFESQTLSAAGNISSGFIAKYRSGLGELIWVKRLIGYETRDLAHDTQGNMYLAGAYGTAASNFDTVPLVPTTLRNSLIAKLDTNANAIWVRHASARNLAESISINGNASLIYVAGSYETEILKVANMQYPVSGGWDVYFGRLSSLPALLDLTLVPSVIHPTCQGSANGSISLAVSGGQLPYVYTWSINNTDSLAENLVAGSYAVTVHDASCDSIVYNTTLTAHALPQVAIQLSADSICAGDSILVSAVATGNAPFTHTWSLGGNTIVADSLYTQVGETIVLTVTDANQCSASDTKTTTVLPLPQTSINAVADSICAGDSIVLKAAATGNGPFAYTWQIDGGLLASDSIFIYEPSIVVLTATDANQCWANDTLAIDQGNCISIGIREMAKLSDITLYPNPTRNGFSIYGAYDSLTSIAIYDMAGSLVQYLDKSIGSYIEISKLAAGIYTVNINTISEKAYLRLIKE